MSRSKDDSASSASSNASRVTSPQIVTVVTESKSTPPESVTEPEAPAWFKLFNDKMSRMARDNEGDEGEDERIL